MSDAIRDAVYLRVGGPASVPPANTKAIYVDTDGSIKAMDSTATKSAIGGGAIAPWFSNVAAFIQALQPTLLAATVQSECVSLSIELESPAAAGSGASSFIVTSPGGIIRSATGATANSFKTIRNKGNVGEPPISNLRTAKWAIATKWKVVQTQALCVHRLANSSDEATFDSGLGIDFSVSSTNYCLRAGSGTQDTGVAFDTTTWHTGIVIADATNLKAYVGAGDGTGIVQVGAAGGLAQSTCPNAAGDWSFFPSNNATTANVESWIDAALVLTERA